VNVVALVVAFGLLLVCGVEWAASYYVAQQHADASDEIAGTLEAPWKTISRAAKTLEPGDTAIIYSGVYREYVEPARGGTPGLPITYRSAEGQEVIVTGADIVTGWTRVNEGVWKKEPWPHRFPTHPNDERHHLIGRCEQVIVGGKLLKHVESLDDVSPGAFFADTKARVLYVSPPDGVDLNEQKVEASVRPLCFGTPRGGEPLSHVRLSGISIRYAANSAQRGALSVQGDHWTIEDCTVEWTNGSGIFFRGNNVTFRRVRSHHNGQQGLAGSGRDFSLEEVVLDHNNVKGFDKGWEAGGFKIVRARNGVVRRCAAIANNGVGFWFDIDVRDVVVEQCLCRDNAGHGIYVEISGGFQIRDNLCVRNGTDDEWGYGGISIAESDHCIIEHNTCVLNPTGISIREQGPRTFGGVGREELSYRVQDITIQRNICALNTKYQFGLWWDNTFFGPHPSAGSRGIACDPDRCNISIDRNLYWTEGGQGLALWGCPWRPKHKKYADLAAWQGERTFDSSSLFASPAFVDQEHDDWNLTSDSPAHRIQAGARVPVFPRGVLPSP
jgi:hypothetical protein